MAWYDSLGLGGLLGSAITAAGYTDMVGDLQGYGKTAQQEATRIGEQAAAASQFKPYTVTTASGGRAGYDTAGNVFQQLGGQEQALQNQLLGQAGGFMTQAGQQNPMLQQQANLFGGMASGYAPSQFTRQQAGFYNPQAVQGMGSYGTSFRPDQISAYGFGNAGIGQFGQQALGMGQQQLAQAGQAPADIEALRGQVAGQAGGMLSQLGQSTQQREQDIYNRIRAAQSPEEQRQALALEERLAAQGRLGVNTAQYGGTPEQLAMAKAQEEAKNSAMLSAMQQAGSEADRAYQQATGLAGLTGSLAGQSSALQSQAQQRATELSNMGMSAAQINSQLQSEGLGRALQAGQYGRQGVQMQEDLLNSSFQRAMQSGQFGREGQALASQLASQQQQRDLASMGFMNQQDQLAAQMRTQDIQNQLALAGGSQGALQNILGLQQGYGQLGQGMLSGAYIPQAQMLNALQAGTGIQQLADIGRRQGAQLQAEAGMSGLEAMLQSQLGAGQLTGQGLSALASILAGSTSNSGMFGDLSLGDIFG